MDLTAPSSVTNAGSPVHLTTASIVLFFFTASGAVENLPRRQRRVNSMSSPAGLLWIHPIWTFFQSIESPRPEYVLTAIGATMECTSEDLFSEMLCVRLNLYNFCTTRHTMNFPSSGPRTDRRSYESGRTNYRTSSVVCIAFLIYFHRIGGSWNLHVSEAATSQSVCSLAGADLWIHPIEPSFTKSRVSFNRHWSKTMECTWGTPWALTDSQLIPTPML
jgi:hypothetical protein